MADLRYTVALKAALVDQLRAAPPAAWAPILAAHCMSHEEAVSLLRRERAFGRRGLHVTKIQRLRHG